jgi:hypothetical protein
MDFRIPVCSKHLVIIHGRLESFCLVLPPHARRWRSFYNFVRHSLLVRSTPGVFIFPSTPTALEAFMAPRYYVYCRIKTDSRHG